MEYHLTPLIQSQNFLKHYDEIEKFLLICSPLELNLCEKFLVQLQEKLESENKGNNYSVLILQILYLVLKFNETRMAFPKNYPIAIHNYKEETHRHLILIIERLLTIPTGKIDQRTQCLIEQIICLLKSQEYYDIILKFYLFLKEKLSVDSLEEIGLNKNFLKCFLKPILIQSKKTF